MAVLTCLGCQGSEYQVGDFVVHLCRAILKPGDEVRGLMLDVRYIPDQNWQESQQALEASSSCISTLLECNDEMCYCN